MLFQSEKRLKTDRTFSLLKLINTHAPGDARDLGAPNKNHTVAAAKKVNEALRDAVNNGKSIKETLSELGKLFANDAI